MTSRLCILVFAACLIGRPCPVSAQQGQRPVRIDGPARLAGTSRYRPGDWGLIGIRLLNPNDEDMTSEVVSFFEQDRLAQFGIQCLVPAGTLRTVVHPIYIPDDLGTDTDRLDLLSMLVEDSAAGEVVQRQIDGELFPSRLIPLAQEFPTTVLMTAGTGREQNAYEATIAVRLDQNLDRRVGLLHEYPLPPDLLAYAGTDQLIIADDIVATDPQAAAAIREWIVGGGHAWVFLESVQQETVQRLLGNNCRVEYVDHITLPEVTIKNARNSATLPLTREYDDPIPLVRVLAEDVEVTHTVNGWPAAFRQKIGRGRVLFTALGARGWIRDREPTDPQPTDPARWSAYVPTWPLIQATAGFFKRPAQGRISTDHLKPYLYERIGHRIVGRLPVVTVLLLFCVGLLSVGLLWFRRRRLERLLWFAPAASVVAIGALGLIGMQTRQGLSDTVAVMQVIDMDTEQDEVHVDGLAAMYSTSKQDAALGGRAGGFVQPERFDREANVRRVVWTDRKQWRWQSLQLDAGLRFAPLSFSPIVDQRIQVTGKFGPDGFLGVLDPGPFQNLSDMVIASSTQHTLALSSEDDRSISGGVNDVQGPGRYIVDTLLTDEQRRRQDVLRELLASSLEQDRYPYQPTVLAWADPLASQFEFADEARRIGSALVAFPVQWERPESGTLVTIPSPFLPYEAVFTDEIGLSPVFDRPSGLWRSGSFPTTALLRFEIPDVVRPLDVQRVKLMLDITAPSRTVGVSLGQPENLIPVSQVEGPLGPVQVEVDDPQTLRLDDAGHLHVLVTVSEIALARDDGSRVGGDEENWQIHSLQMELSGRTQQANPNH